MTREEAIETIKKVLPMSKTLEDAFYTLHPELCESEDEKIRKEIISALKFANVGGVYDKHIVYLERQKEQIPITESERLANEVIKYLTRCGYSPVLKDDSKKEHFHIDIPRHKDDFWLSEEYKHCRSVLGEYYMEGDYGGDTYTLYIWRVKKEQKPEVDLEKELDKFYGMYRKDGKTYDIEDGEECVDWKEMVNPYFEVEFARHFYELGKNSK